MTKAAGKVLYAASSSECNNNCVFCTDVSGRGRRRGGGAVDGLRAPARGRRLVFTSGEPTLNPDLPALIGEAARLGCSGISVITNGRMLAYRDYCSKLLASGASEVIVSLHGARPEVHDAITGAAGSWAQTVRGLSNLLSLRPKGSPVQVSVNATVNALNIDGLGELRDFFLSLRGLRNIVFHGLLPFGRALKDWKKLSVRYSRLVEELAPARGRWPRSLRLWDVPLCAALPRVPAGACEFAMRRTEMLRRRGRSVDGHREKTALRCCRACSKLAVCGGVYAKYLETYGDSEFHAL
ncbi:MAG: radical SAM protein [Elusimicrobia bacterium]|nr:radical SAM protein [Elusimicrobiota bacterium]